MSILDAVTNVVERHPDVSEEQHNTLLQSAMEMFGNSGGLSTLLSNAGSQGLGHIVGSWIGTGSNQAVSADQVQQLVGQDRISQIASRAGIPSGMLVQLWHVFCQCSLTNSLRMADYRKPPNMAFFLEESMKAFVVGFGLGAVGGLLFAPKRGELTRADLRARMQNLISTASERIEQPTSSQESFEFTKKSSQSTSETEDRKPGAVEILNSAAREALIAVHGIGEVLADRIIEHRPYQQAYEVVEKGILPESTFVQLRRQLLDKSA